MLSSKKIFSKQSLGVIVTAMAVAFGLFIGVAGPSKAQDKQDSKDKKDQPQGFKTQKEYDEANAAAKEPDPAKRLPLIDTWKKDFPATEFLDARQDLYLQTYAALKDARHTFDEALEILKTRPNNLPAIGDVLQMVMGIKPAPTPADLDAAEKVANTQVFDTDTFYAASNKPKELMDADWQKAKQSIPPYAEQILIAIYGARNNPKRAVDDLTKLIKHDPTLAAASYQLGSNMLKVFAADNALDKQPLAFWQFARAASYDGPGALPAAQKKIPMDFLTGAYTKYHGSSDGLNDLLAKAKTSAFPPDNFHIDSIVDIANKQAAADAAARAANPIVYMWANDIKARLLKDDSLWDSAVKDTILPPDKDGMPQYFEAKIVSMMPATNPKELTVAIEKPDVADAKLELDKPLDGKMEPGESIQFKGQTKEWTKDPFMITFIIADPKEDIKGWTGKKAGPARGAGRGATKGTGKAGAK